MFCSYCSQEEETGSGWGRKIRLSEGWKLKEKKKSNEKSKMGIYQGQQIRQSDQESWDCETDGNRK